MSEIAVLECRDRLSALAAAHHRGRGDTWTAARDRAAREIGLSPSYAARIWHRWQGMQDVSGGAYRRLHLAYTAMCERNETVAAATRARREEIEHGPAYEEPAGTAAGAAAAAARPAASPPRAAVNA